MKLTETVRKFLEKEHQGGELLLALSGGADSLSLFHALRQLEVKFSVAHVNHGLREESHFEEAELQKFAEQAHIPFFLKRLQLHDGPNLEERARLERYQFFETLAKEHSIEAVLLGHHADDQGETLLKRLFEGTSLRKWHGILPVTQKNDLTLWRPLLNTRKKVIVAWLKELGIAPFEDWTNTSDKNLRGKLRTTIFPFLSQQFGKEIISPLLQHQQDVLECVDFLDELAKNYTLDTDIFQIPKTHRALQKHLIRKWLEKKGASIATSVLHDLIESLSQNGLRSFHTSYQQLFLLDCKIYF